MVSPAIWRTMRTSMRVYLCVHLVQSRLVSVRLAAAIMRGGQSDPPSNPPPRFFQPDDPRERFRFSFLRHAVAQRQPSLTRDLSPLRISRENENARSMRAPRAYPNEISAVSDIYFSFYARVYARVYARIYATFKSTARPRLLISELVARYE